MLESRDVETARTSNERAPLLGNGATSNRLGQLFRMPVTSNAQTPLDGNDTVFNEQAPLDGNGATSNEQTPPFGQGTSNSNTQPLTCKYLPHADTPCATVFSVAALYSCVRSLGKIPQVHPASFISLRCCRVFASCWTRRASDAAVPSFLSLSAAAIVAAESHPQRIGSLFWLDAVVRGSLLPLGSTAQDHCRTLANNPWSVVLPLLRGLGLLHFCP
ncbi:hypothetical protein AVEN_142911-1 [Araneus ventricosus]|uniref:Uncharacterized protein n=1 Tax=Araneus ventricosus TaxID=182803 RepID=A0A4Y2FLP8_ARAVE|nr:hypothetical protein AVEN_142911-1 [Araneus ventricosus]